jgi:hypothetical protein
MPRVIPFPPVEDARDAQAWSAFAAEDAAARAPAALEARVMRAAQRAVAERRRAEIDCRRRLWLGAAAAIAAGLVAAAGWSLAPRATPVPHAAAAAPPAAVTPAPSIVPVAKGGRGRVPMTNVEAGRVLGPVPPPALVTRSLFDLVAESAVRAPIAPRPRSFGSEPSAPALTEAQIADAAPPAPVPEMTPGLHPPVVPAPAATALSSRGFRGVFDRSQPGTADGEPGYRLELATPLPVAPPPK